MKITSHKCCCDAVSDELRVSLFPRESKGVQAVEHLWTCVSCCDCDVKGSSVLMTSLTGSVSLHVQKHTLPYVNSSLCTLFSDSVSQAQGQTHTAALMSSRRNSLFSLLFSHLPPHKHTHTNTHSQMSHSHDLTADLNHSYFCYVFTLIMKPEKHMIDWLQMTRAIFKLLIAAYEACRRYTNQLTQADTNILVCRQAGISCPCSPEKGINFRAV